MTSTTTKGLAKVAGIVAVATLLSKAMGFLRQTMIAAIYGSGVEYTAFAVAYILPGFLFILLGGINGPFHSAIISVMKKRPGEDQSRWLESVTTLVGVILLAISLVLWLTADGIVFVIAPGSSPIVHTLAAQQLRIMTPLAVLAGLIGIGFGTLNASNFFLLPSLSPILSSVMVVLALLAFGHSNIPSLIAWGTLAGAVAQWLVQLVAQSRYQVVQPRIRFDWGSPEVKTVGLIMLPAVISSGMIHINVYVDMFFASFVPGDRTIGNLGYAQLLVQTPLGVLSNMVLVPLMPLFSSLALPDQWPELRQRIRQALIGTTALILPLSMLMVVLAQPIVQVAYQRGKFTAEITQEVAALLIAYGIGMMFYLLRDVVVRIFYALEDARTPLLISVVAILLNAIFDYIGIQIFGAPGLALSTATVNGIAFVWLCVMLQKRLGGLPWPEITRILALLLALTALSGGITWILWQQIHLWLPTENPGLIIAQAGVAGGIGLLVFGFGSSQLRIPEVNELIGRIRRRLP